MPEDRSHPPWTDRNPPGWFEAQHRGPAIAALGVFLIVGGGAAFLRYLWTFAHECAPEYVPGIGCYGKAPLVQDAAVALTGLALTITGSISAWRTRRRLPSR